MKTIIFVRTEQNEKYMQQLTKSHLAKLYNVSESVISAKFAERATDLRDMQKKAEKKGKKYNGYTVAQLKNHADSYNAKALSVGTHITITKQHTRLDNSIFQFTVPAKIVDNDGYIATYTYLVPVIDPELGTKFLGGGLSVQNLDFLIKNGTVKF